MQSIRLFFFFFPRTEFVVNKTWQEKTTTSHNPNNAFVLVHCIPTIANPDILNTKFFSGLDRLQGRIPYNLSGLNSVVVGTGGPTVILNHAYITLLFFKVRNNATMKLLL